jgi:6-phosphogluconate dehydrogenase
MRGAANSYKMHHEKLKELNAVLEADIVNANMNLEHITYEYDLLKQEKSVVRTEAVKEFAEKLHKKKHIVQLVGSGALVPAVAEKDIEDIAKEMIGEET